MNPEAILCHWVSMREDVALSSSPGGPASSQARKVRVPETGTGVWILVSQREGHAGQQRDHQGQVS